MHKPSLHMNGTSREELFESYLNAGRAVRAAMDALGKAAPHGRDYYPQGNDAIQTAILEHNARVGQLLSVYRDLQELAEHCGYLG